MRHSSYKDIIQMPDRFCFDKMSLLNAPSTLTNITDLLLYKRCTGSNSGRDPQKPT